MAINFFYSAIQRKLQELIVGYEAPLVVDIRVEVFDMAGVTEAGGITLADLVRCGQGHTIVSLLLNAKGFWKYDNRESLLQASDDSDSSSDIFSDTATTAFVSNAANSQQVLDDDVDTKDDYEDDYEDDFF